MLEEIPMTNPNTVRPEEELCECAQWARTGHILNTKHHRNCPGYAPEKEAEEIIEKLIQGIIDWGNDGDGIPSPLYETFEQACAFTNNWEWVRNE